jgi:hypothetical protein
MLVGLPYMTVTFWENPKILTPFELPGWRDEAAR